MIDQEQEVDTSDLDSGQAEEAFVKAKAGFELFGQPLKPYTPSRKVAAQSMGMLYPFVGETGQAQFEATNSYPGILKDMIICLWLCTLKDPSDQTKAEFRAGAWNPSRALAKPTEALEAAMGWAVAQDLTDMLKRPFQEALQVFLAIVTGVAASEFELRIEEPTDEQRDELESQDEGDKPDPKV